MGNFNFVEVDILKCRDEVFNGNSNRTIAFHYGITALTPDSDLIYKARAMEEWGRIWALRINEAEYRFDVKVINALELAKQIRQERTEDSK